VGQSISSFDDNFGTKAHCGELVLVDFFPDPTMYDSPYGFFPICNPSVYHPNIRQSLYIRQYCSFSKHVL